MIVLCVYQRGKNSTYFTSNVVYSSILVLVFHEIELPFVLPGLVIFELLQNLNHVVGGLLLATFAVRGVRVIVDGNVYENISKTAQQKPKNRSPPRFLGVCLFPDFFTLDIVAVVLN